MTTLDRIVDRIVVYFGLWFISCCVWINYNAIQDTVKSCPNCRAKDSLYLECNGKIAKANRDSSYYIK